VCGLVQLIGVERNRQVGMGRHDGVLRETEKAIARVAFRRTSAEPLLASAPHGRGMK